MKSLLIIGQILTFIWWNDYYLPWNMCKYIDYKIPQIMFSQVNVWNSWKCKSLYFYPHFVQICPKHISPILFMSFQSIFHLFLFISVQSIFVQSKVWKGISTINYQQRLQKSLERWAWSIQRKTKKSEMFRNILKTKKTFLKSFISIFCILLQIKKNLYITIFIWKLFQCKVKTFILHLNIINHWLSCTTMKNQIQNFDKSQISYKYFRGARVDGNVIPVEQLRVVILVNMESDILKLFFVFLSHLISLSSVYRAERLSPPFVRLTKATKWLFAIFFFVFFCFLLRHIFGVV